MHITRSLALAALLLAPLLRAESPLYIANALYAVEYDTSAAEFSINPHFPALQSDPMAHSRASR